MKKFRLFFAFAALLAIIAAEGAPRYVFYFIGDGMGASIPTLAQLYKRTVLADSVPLALFQMPVAGLATTHSYSSPVTDSAAAGTALATGRKTVNGMVGVLPDSTAVVSIAKRLFDVGYGVGLVTTVAPDDATPAAFYAHQPSRTMHYEIGLDAARSGYQFLAGANLRGVTCDGRSTDLLKVMADSGVAVVRGIDALRGLDSERIVLLNTDTVERNDVGYSIDSVTTVLTLPQMTAACIDHLLRHTPEKFFMMVEGGSIDHAAHSNDAAAQIMEMLTFDKALSQALEFYAAHPGETLIVVTADHETGGLMLGNREYAYMIYPENLKYTRRSYDKFLKECRALMDSRRIIRWCDMREILAGNFGLFGQLKVDDTDEKTLREAFEKMDSLRNSADREALKDAAIEFASGVRNLVNRLAGIGWTTGYHTGTVVPVYAIGVGADKFTGVIDNTMIPAKIAEITGVKL